MIIAQSACSQQHTQKACLLKNITLAGKFCFKGMKIDFHEHEFRFRPIGIKEKQQ